MQKGGGESHSFKQISSVPIILSLEAINLASILQMKPNIEI